MHIIEETVKFLCEKAEHPNDEFDVLAQRLDEYSDQTHDLSLFTPSERVAALYKGIENKSIAQGVRIERFNELPWYKRVWLVLQGRIF